MIHNNNNGTMTEIELYPQDAVARACTHVLTVSMYMFMYMYIVIHCEIAIYSFAYRSCIIRVLFAYLGLSSIGLLILIYNCTQPAKQFCSPSDRWPASVHFEYN